MVSLAEYRFKNSFEGDFLAPSFSLVTLLVLGSPVKVYLCRRYQFLAFDFDENVEINQDNCRLLLIRLKMEGWMIGKTKVFLKYYNEEYLSRLYETQVKKIVKVQCMMRAFLARKNIATKVTSVKKEIGR